MSKSGICVWKPSHKFHFLDLVVRAEMSKPEEKILLIFAKDSARIPCFHGAGSVTVRVGENVRPCTN